MKNLKHFMHRIEQQIKAEENVIRTLSEKYSTSSAIQLQHKNKKEKFAIIHPCTDGQHIWQISKFDELGAYGDSRRNTLAECFKVALQDNFRKVVDHVI